MRTTELIQLIQLLDKADTSETPEHPLVGHRVIVRTRISGVSIGTLASVTYTPAGPSCTLIDAIRLWSWTSGAFTLSEVAMKGPEGCRIARHPDGIEIADQGWELIPMGDEAWSVLMAGAVEGAQ